MQILFVVPYIPSLIRVRPYHFIRELARRHSISLLAVDSSDAARDLDRLSSFCQSVDLIPLRLSQSLRSCARAVAAGDPLQAAVCQSPALDNRLRALLGERRFDVVHVEHLRAAALGRVLPPNTATVFDAVDSISLLLKRTLRSSHSVRQRVIAALELRRTMAFEGRVLNRFDETVVTSPDDKRSLQALAPRASINVIPNGVDLDYFQPLNRPRDSSVLVFSGKMSYHANVTAALHFVRDIFPHIRARRPETRLRIVGSQPPEAIQQLAADPCIEVTGYVDDLRNLVGSAGVAICPMTVKVGVQNKLLEAMAMGVPVVATSLGAEGLMAQPGRDLLVADHAADFAAGVLRLFDQPEIASRVGQAGRLYVETHHRWVGAAERLESVYESAIRGTRSRLSEPIAQSQPELNLFES